MSDDLKLPQVGELTLPQWQDWLLRYNSVLSDRERRIEKLEAGINALVNCQSALPRAALREAAADILDKRTWRTEDQSPLVSQNHALRFRIEKLEAALREIIVHCEVPAPPNAEALKMFARKALEGKDG